MENSQSLICSNYGLGYANILREFAFISALFVYFAILTILRVTGPILCLGFRLNRKWRTNKSRFCYSINNRHSDCTARLGKSSKSYGRSIHVTLSRRCHRSCVRAIRYGDSTKSNCSMQQRKKARKNGIDK
jgi:hypothetical protein